MRIMDMRFSTRKLVVALFLITLFCRTCKALDGHKNCSSLCGDHNVISPFRLKDTPEECGDKRYNLSCEHNQLVMYWQSGRYRVMSINYENYTIRVRDANIAELDSSSSLPGYSLTDYNFSERDPYSTIEELIENGDWCGYELNTNMIYVRCEHPMDSARFVDIAPCFKTSNGSVSSSSSNLYAYVGSSSIGDVGLGDGCLLELMYMTSWPALEKNKSARSCTDIRNMLLHGFELSWLNSLCPNTGEYVGAPIIYAGNKQLRPVCLGVVIAENRTIIFETILLIMSER